MRQCYATERLVYDFFQQFTDKIFEVQAWTGHSLVFSVNFRYF